MNNRKSMIDNLKIGEEKKSGRRYEKPIIVKQKKMTFPMDIIAKFNGGRFCVQCSGCHGCR